ncbi:AsmA family protein, partial [Frateuria defendens]|uniref:AsmA family protein n=1 Tax=Frateuria defendens TaxID=2219559 RepID=UPI00066FF5AC
MRRNTKVLAWIVGILLVLIVLPFVILALLDWNRFKPTVNARVSEAIGRPFVIDGELGVAWRREPAEGGLRALLPWPEFTARDVRIGNPDWARQREFARLDAV